MLDMSAWPEMDADVLTDLRLDPHNVRLEVQVGAPEADIMLDLLQNEKTLELVKGICRLGYLSHEVPIVVNRSGDLVVVEGNRRVAALKAIQNPLLVPTFRTQIEKLVTQIPNRAALRSIRVKQAPSQIDADQLIAAIHTSNQRLAWSRNRQTEFFRAQLDSGKSLPELLDLYPTIDVRDFVIRSRVLQLFRNAKYPDLVLRSYVRNRRFPVTVLERLYENKDFLKVAKIKVDSELGEVSLDSTDEAFSKLATKIVADIRSKRIDTRTLNSFTSESYQSYLGELETTESDESLETTKEPDESKQQSESNEGIDPEVDRETSATRPSANSEAANQTPNPDVTNPNKANSRQSTSKNSPSLNVAGLRVPDQYPDAIRHIFVELGSINLRNFPNAALDLLRSFLEKTIKVFAGEIGQPLTNPNNRPVQLTQCLKWLEDFLEKRNQKAASQVLKKLRSGSTDDFRYSEHTLNAMNHNPHLYATSEDVHQFWGMIRPLIEVLFNPTSI